jgi:hypothetical protein
VHRRAIVAAALATALPAASLIAQDSAYSRAFDRADRDPQTVVAHLRCISELVARVRNSGLRSQLDSADVICVHITKPVDRFVGVIVRTDSTWRKATRFVAIEPDFGGHLVNPLDTADVLVLLRAQRYAEWLDAKRGDTSRSLPTVVYRTDTLIHAWIIPAAIIPWPSRQAYVGGERHYVFPADAKKELFVVPPPAIRPVKGDTADGQWVIESADSIPTFSELLMAHMVRMEDRPATILTPTRTARLSGGKSIFSGVGVVGWSFTPRKP